MEENLATPQPVQKPALKKKFPTPLVVTAVVVVGVLSLLFLKKSSQNTPIFSPTPIPAPKNSFYDKDTFVKIKSDSDFIELVSAGQNSQQRLPMTGGGELRMMAVKSSPSDSSGQAVERSSGTNVQVVGIDEPDIVKTDNTSIYYSKQGQYRCFGGVSGGISLMKTMPSQRCSQTNSEIAAVSAVPATAMKVQGSIPENGELLVSDKMLIVFGNSEQGALQLSGYSVINPSTPKKMWELPFSNRSQKIGARLYKGNLYVVTSTTPTLPRPCPMPLIEGKTMMKIRCSDIYMPSSKPLADAVYSVVKINPQTGAATKSISFIAQQGQTDLYMSPNALYLSYQMQGNSLQILNQFMAENKGVFPSYIEDKVNKLLQYDLTQSTKEMEMNNLLSYYLSGMDESERLKQENQLQNTFKRFFNKYKRSFDYTGLVKIGNEDLRVMATGKVPGFTLNQYAYDEWKGDLRIATTIGGRNPFYMFGSNDLESQVSDVYVLGGNLEVKGSAKDLGKTERIYSVRFMEDRGYIVTFRQTDPFYVLDLSNGNAPVVKGELKIPGYSSYLHELSNHLVLGIGRENQVKLSLFDVSDPKSPKEVSRYDLAGEYWSEAMDNPHAFLQDAKYKIFFLPGSRGGYIFSYEGQTLNLVKAIESPIVKRGLYLNDYFYVVSDTGITSFKEGTWDKVGEVLFVEKLVVEPTPFEEPPILLEDLQTQTLAPDIAPGVVNKTEGQ
ncbi:MAG: beta-propeller domain-containing protein [Microgenomates group bacterium]